MATFENKWDTTLMAVIKKATDFHGHLGPFLVIGVRMGLIGIRELGAKRNDEELHVTAMTKPYVPFSCFVDGVQVATHCTIGNRKLRLRVSSSIAAKFELQNGEQVTVRVNPSTFNGLKNGLLAEESSPEEVRKLVEIVASMPEKELFMIEGK